MVRIRREIGSVHHEVIKFVSYLWSKGVFEAINYGVWSWLTRGVKCQSFLLFPLNFSWKRVLSHKRISKARYVNAVKYHYWSFAICCIVSDSCSMLKNPHFYFDSVGVQVSPSGPHAAMVDILWTKPCRNILILKVPSWPWKQQTREKKLSL